MASTDPSDLNKLLLDIDAVFSDNARPEEWPHDEPASIADHAGSTIAVSDEAIAAARAFCGVNWIALDSAKYEVLSRQYTEPFLSFHSHAAFKYYLPAYMKMVALDARAREHLVGPLVHALTITTDTRKKALRDWQQARFEQFSAEQAKVIVAFLGWVRQRHGVASGKVGPDGAWDDFAEPIEHWRVRVSGTSPANS